MDNNRTRLTDRTTQPTSMGGLGTNMRRLKTDGAATIAELRDFLGNMRGRSPQEVLGQVANSSLFKCTVWTVIGTFALMAGGTLASYYLNPPKPAKPPAKPVAASPAAPAAAPANATAPAATPEAKSPTDDANVSPDMKKAAARMGIDETKSSDPKKNPLDKGSDLDKLLDIKE